jgi:hypothetical protein
MEEDFKWKASLRSDEELRERVDNREKYLPETIEASLAELQFRRVVFSDEELKVINEDVQARRDMAARRTGFDGLFNNSEKIKQVQDPDAPAFYSKQAIYGFSIVFSVLFGSILFAINVAKTPKKLHAIWPVIYGLAFCFAQVTVTQNVRPNIGFSIIAGILGAFPLNYFFWGKFIGDSTLYRVKPIWMPLVVAIVISAFIIYMVLNYSPGKF